MTTLVLAAALTIGAFPSATVDAAYADFYAQRTLGYECRYLSCTADQEPVAKFVAVLASREPLLDYQIPVRVQPGLLRLNLTALRWSAEDWAFLFGSRNNPYTVNSDQLIVSAGFFIDRIADGRSSDAYLRLHFGGGAIPKTRDEFLRAVGVDPAKQRGLAFGLVEGTSGVNVARNGARLIEHNDGVFSESWITSDVKQVAPGADPLESLDRSFRFDGQEFFGLIPKVSTSGVRGLFPVTGLANAQGNIVNEAPVDLVEDSTRFRGQSAIVNPGSCVQCHTAGSQRPSINALRDRLSKGVELLSYDKRKQVEIELFHLGDVTEALDRWDRGFASALLVVNGLTPQANAAAFTAAVNAYHADVMLKQAADELFCTPAELRLALGYASAQKLVIDNRLAGLAHDIPLPRSSWEQGYLKADAILQFWRKANQ